MPDTNEPRTDAANDADQYQAEFGSDKLIDWYATAAGVSTDLYRTQPCENDPMHAHAVVLLDLVVESQDSDTPTKLRIAFSDLGAAMEVGQAMARSAVMAAGDQNIADLLIRTFDRLGEGDDATADVMLMSVLKQLAMRREAHLGNVGGALDIAKHSHPHPGPLGPNTEGAS